MTLYKVTHLDRRFSPCNVLTWCYASEKEAYRMLQSIRLDILNKPNQYVYLYKERS